MTLKQSQGHQIYIDNVHPKQVITMQRLKDPALMVSEKKPTKFSNKDVSIISLEYVQK